MVWRKIPGWPKWCATENRKHVATIFKSESQERYRVWADGGQGLQEVTFPMVHTSTPLKEAKATAESALGDLRMRLGEVA